jgi:hypothetical protein
MELRYNPDDAENVIDIGFEGRGGEARGGRRVTQRGRGERYAALLDVLGKR